jgi:cell division protein FtsN
MSSENKKLIWISVAVAGFVLLLAASLLFFFAPNSKKGGAAAPATIGNTAAPKSADPQDYLSAPPPSPAAPASSPNGDVIVIYGDKPSLPNSATTEPPTQAAPAPDASAGAPQSAAQDGAQPTAPQAAPRAAAQKPAPKAAPAKPAPAAATAKKPAATVSKPQPKAPVDQYWIQAASFAGRTKADELKEELARRGVAAIVTVKDIGGKRWYRVRVGPYGTQTEAEGWLSKLKAMPGCAEAGIWKSTARN